MQVEKTTGLFMVQRTTPEKFLGTVTCIISGDDAGWTSGLLDRSAEGWSLVASNEAGLSLIADMEMALRFAAILMVTSAQGLPYSDGFLEFGLAEGSALRDGRQRLVSITVPKTGGVKALEAEEGEAKFRLAPGLARAVAMKVFEVAALMWESGG